MRLWSSLSTATKAKYRKQGVSPQRYNAWQKKSKRSKAQLARHGTTRSSFLGLNAPDRASVFNRLHSMYAGFGRYDRHTVARNVSKMTDKELRFAARASYDELAQVAGDASRAHEDSPYYYH